MKRILLLYLLLIPIFLQGQIAHGHFQYVQTDSIFPRLSGHYKAGSGSQDTVIAFVDGKEVIKVVDESNLEPYEIRRDTIQVYFSPDFVLSVISEIDFCRLYSLKDSVTLNLKYVDGEYKVGHIFPKLVETHFYQNYKIINHDLDYLGMQCKEAEYERVRKKKSNSKDKLKAILAEDVSFPANKLILYPNEVRSLPLYFEHFFGEFKHVIRILNYESCSEQDLLDKIDEGILNHLGSY